MIKLVNELCFIQGQQIGRACVPEQVAVIRHVEHRRKANAPGIDLGFDQLRAFAFPMPNGLADENRGRAQYSFLVNSAS
jgi:hypothetical protein